MFSCPIQLFGISHLQPQRHVFGRFPNRLVGRSREQPGLVRDSSLEVRGGGENHQFPGTQQRCSKKDCVLPFFCHGNPPLDSTRVKMERPYTPLRTSSWVYLWQVRPAAIDKHTVKKILLFIIVFFGVLAGISYVKARITTPQQGTPGPSCDVSLWAHVYHGRFLSAEDRLQVINPCLTITGTIVHARPEADGDWHIQLDLDSEYRSLLNQANLEKQQGYLVLEPMCINRVSQTDTLEEGVCNGFSQNTSALTS